MNKKIALLTSRYWEGAFVAKILLDHCLPLEHIFIQKSWWRPDNSHEYSEQYLSLLEQDRHATHRRYFTLEEVSAGKEVNLHRINSINEDAAVSMLKQIDPAVIVVVGSRIIKGDIFRHFAGRILNFHTGALPRYRGPHSEFWAMYNLDRQHIGTTIHYLEEGIDTGRIVAYRATAVPEDATPHEAHIHNVINGAQLLAETIEIQLLEPIPGRVQDPALAGYYTYPTDEQISILEQKLGRKIDLYFAD